MKKLQKTLSLLLIISLLVQLIPMSFIKPFTVQAVELPSGPTEGACGDNLTWTLTEDTSADWDLTYGAPYKLTITGTGAMEDYTSINSAPWHGYLSYITSVSIGSGVTTIGSRAFRDCASLKNISMASSVVSIGDYAFNACTTLQTVTIGSGVVSIGDYAFDDCADLQTLTLGSSVTTIGTWAFSYCSDLTTITFNNALQTIDNYAFYCCYSLKNVSLPASVTTIGYYSFGYSGLTSFTVPANVTRIRNAALAYCYSLSSISVVPDNTTYKVTDNVLYLYKDSKPYCAIAYPSACNNTTVNIADGTQSITSCAFAAASKITSLTLPNTLTEISSAAFERISITELSIPDSVISLAPNAFRRCSYLETIDIGTGTASLAEAFRECTAIKTITVSEENTNLNSIDNVVFNEDYTTLQLYAPAKSDTEYHMPDTVTTLSTAAFYYAQNLQELYMSKTLTTIGNDSVRSNNSLKSIYFTGNAPSLSSSVTSICNNASNLILYRAEYSTGWDNTCWKSYTILSWDPYNDFETSGTVGDLTWKFEGNMGRLTFTGTGVIPDYDTHILPPWNEYMNYIQTIEADEVSDIGSYTFNNAINLVRTETSINLIHIGDYAFANCSNMKFIDINTAETIGAYAFINNSSIEGAINLHNVSLLGEGAFKNCTGIENITLGSQLTALEKETFSGCSLLYNLIIPENVTIIAERALADCTALRSINIPAAVKTIGTQAFSGASTLEKIYFYGNIPSEWITDCFESCNDNLILYYRSTQTDWNALNGTWNEIPVIGLDRFYTEQKDYYSFSNNASSFGYTPTYRIPRQRYVDVLDSIVKGSYYYSINNYWNGSCYGMAGTTLEFYENDLFHIQDYDATAENLYDIAAPGSKTSELTKLIEGYQISQYKPEISGCDGDISNNMKNYQGLIHKVEEFERSGGLRIDSQAEPVVMAIYSFFGGHAVVPVSVVQDSNGDFLLQVYDCNYPASFQTLKIYKDFSGISYGQYRYASYAEYSTIASSMYGVQLYTTENEKDTSVYLSIDKETAAITNAEGKDIEDIEGAYEQKALTGEEEEKFSGIRSFVLPKGNYELTAATTSEDDIMENSETEDVTFFLASDGIFAEITSTDEDTTLLVDNTASDDNNETDSTEETGSEENTEETTDNRCLKLELTSNSEETETATIALTNEQGEECTLEITAESGTTTLTIDQESNLMLEVSSTKADVTMDGEKIELNDGKLEQKIALSENETPVRIKDLIPEVICNKDNKLTGTLHTTLLSDASAENPVNATLTADFIDESGNTIATYSEEIVLSKNIHSLEMSFPELDTTLNTIEASAKLYCRLTASVSDTVITSMSSEDFTIVITQPEPTEPPTQPTETPTVPTEAPTIPSVTPTVPTEAPTIPSVTPTVPTEAPTIPSEIPTVPTEAPTIPSVTPSVPTEAPTIPSVTPTIPTELPTQPTFVTETPNTVPSVVNVKKVIVSPKKLKLGVGESYQLKTTIKPANATNKGLTFKTSNKNITISKTGMIKAKKTGTTKITIIASNNKKTFVMVTVKKAPKKIILNAKTKKLKKGKTFKIKVKLPGNAVSKKITYTSNKPSIATVSKEGKVTARKKGTAIITVKTYNNKTAKLKVIIK